MPQSASNVIALLLEALRRLGAPDAVAAAFLPEARVEIAYRDAELRSGVLQGQAEIAAWFGAMQGRCDFFAEPPLVLPHDGEGEALRVRYGYHHEQFTAWGWWTIEAEQGRIRRLVHSPDPLPRTPREWWEQHGVRITHLPVDQWLGEGEAPSGNQGDDGA